MMVRLYRMVTLKGKTDPLRLMGRRMLLALLIVLVFSAIWGVWNIYRKNAEAARLREQAERKLEDLQDRQARLEEDYEQLKTTRGIEEALREQYAVGAAGERLIVIVEPQAPEPVRATSSIMQWIRD